MKRTDSWFFTLYTMPPRINASYKTGNGRFYKSSEAKQAQEAIAWEAKEQWHPRKPLKGKISLTARFYFKRARDIDSGTKSLLDALTGVTYDDDTQVHELHLYKYEDKKSPRVELSLKEI